MKTTILFRYFSPKTLGLLGVVALISLANLQCSKKTEDLSDEKKATDQTAALNLTPAQQNFVNAKTVEEAIGKGLDVEMRDFYIPQPSEMEPNPFMMGMETSRRDLIITLVPNVSKERFDELVKLSGGELGGTFPKANIFQVVFPEGNTFEQLDAAVKLLKAQPDVLAVTHDIKHKPAIVPPKNSHVTEEYPWSSLGGGNWNLEYIEAPSAWDLKYAIEKAGRELVKVMVIDGGFLDHPELVGIVRVIEDPNLIFFGGPTPHDSSHGTMVSAIIGAKWNGRDIDGITQYVQMTLSPRSITSPLIDALALIWADGYRVVNYSLAMEAWNLDCFDETPTAPGRRCDPSGQASDGQSCSSWARVVMKDAGIPVASSVIAINSQTPTTLFVAAAGNSSGELLKPGEDYCRTIFENAQPGAIQKLLPSNGLGQFPSEWESDFAWAAKNVPLAAEHIIVVEAGKPMPSVDNAASMQRSDYSSVFEEGILAPADFYDRLWFSNNPFITGNTEGGTSSATPMVTGSVAYLLAVEPSLTNQEIKQILGKDELNLYDSLVKIDDIRPDRNPTVLTQLHDFNDCSEDGFQRFIYDADSKVIGDYDSMPCVDDKVDIKDFRRFRDSMLMAAHQAQMYPPEFSAVADPGDKDNDLNQDDRSGYNPDIEEHYPLGGTSLGDFVGAYEKSDAYSSQLQPFPPTDLTVLLNASDLIIRSAAAKAETCAEKIELSLEPGFGKNNLILDKDETVLTTPSGKDIKVIWKPVCADGSLGDPTEQQLEVELLPGQDWVVVLKAKEGTVGCCGKEGLTPKQQCYKQNPPSMLNQKIRDDKQAPLCGDPCADKAFPKATLKWSSVQTAPNGKVTRQCESTPEFDETGRIIPGAGKGECFWKSEAVDGRILWEDKTQGIPFFNVQGYSPDQRAAIEGAIRCGLPTLGCDAQGKPIVTTGEWKLEGKDSEYNRSVGIVERRSVQCSGCGGEDGRMQEIWKDITCDDLSNPLRPEGYTPFVPPPSLPAAP